MCITNFSVDRIPLARDNFPLIRICCYQLDFLFRNSISKEISYEKNDSFSSFYHYAVINLLNTDAIIFTHERN